MSGESQDKPVSRDLAEHVQTTFAAGKRVVMEIIQAVLEDGKDAVRSGDPEPQEGMIVTYTVNVIVRGPFKTCFAAQRGLLRAFTRGAPAGVMAAAVAKGHASWDVPHPAGRAHHTVTATQIHVKEEALAAARAIREQAKAARLERG